MNFKSIVKTVISIEQAEGVGARVRRSIGTTQLRNLDPFLMLDEFKTTTKGGFPDHPHRGFETVTYMLKGKFEHEDIHGHRGIIGPGDLQWMTAGKGIIHAEMPITDDATGLQLWINLPAKDKMCNAKYQELNAKDVPLVTKEGVKVKVIAGESLGVNAKVHTNSPIYYLDIEVEAGHTFEQPVPENWTCFIYTLEGNGTFAGVEVDPHSTVVFSQDGTLVKAEATTTPIKFVLIAGKPIGEPIVQHGPFVMNTAEEIQSTFEDYQANRNGFENAFSWKSVIGNRK
jgi:hypothetical protein